MDEEHKLHAVLCTLLNGFEKEIIGFNRRWKEQHVWVVLCKKPSKFTRLLKSAIGLLR